MSVKPTNHELLGRKWEYMWPLAELLEHRRQDAARLERAPDPQSRSSQIRDKLLYPTLQHLGFGPIPTEDIRKEVERAVDLTLEYFHGTWWFADEVNRLDLTQADRENLIEMNLLAMDKSRPDRQLEWYDAFTSALFLAGLAGRWDDLAKISSWFDATIEPEYQVDPVGDEYQQLFLCIAGSLSPQPMEGADELLAKVKKCRTKRPRLLCAAWEAANAADQAAFNKAFPATVKHFLTLPVGGQAYHWVAIDQSSVWLIAEHRGLKFPPLSEKEQAAVVTRQSAGLVP